MSSALTAESRARNIKLLLFDVDGVLTNGEIVVQPNADGSATEIKAFTAHDGLGIALARLAGLRIGIITKRDTPAVAVRSRDLKIEFVYQGQHDKLTAAEEIAAKAGVDMSQVAFVGDDIVDLPVLRVCGLAVATANARSQVKAIAHYTTPLPGGEGAGRDAIDFILTAQGKLDATIEQYLDPSNPSGITTDSDVRL